MIVLDSWGLLRGRELLYIKSLKVSFLSLYLQLPHWFLLNHLRKQKYFYGTLSHSSYLSLHLSLLHQIDTKSCLLSTFPPLIHFSTIFSLTPPTLNHTLRLFFKKSSLWLNLLDVSQIFPFQTFLGHLSPLTTFAYIVLPWLPGQPLS